MLLLEISVSFCILLVSSFITIVIVIVRGPMMRFGSIKVYATIKDGETVPADRQYDSRWCQQGASVRSVALVSVIYFVSDLCWKRRVVNSNSIRATNQPNSDRRPDENVQLAPPTLEINLRGIIFFF